ncbi:deoxyribonuclease V [Microtetraspora niveoalba]|uniref:deoxyribonuclease V n=1 Tax=Microtetraspora niveoalba TaxID=46175 RepID=UPI000B1EA2AF|nr:deoxyribonuclease V [Microtetraspora niveoalba]
MKPGGEPGAGVTGLPEATAPGPESSAAGPESLAVDRGSAVVGPANAAVELESTAVGPESPAERPGPLAGRLTGFLDEWPMSVAEAEAAQERLRPLTDLADPGPETVLHVAGLDVAYATEGDGVTAAVVVLDARTLDVVDQAVVRERARFPYVPGLFAFRELPPLLTALERLRVTPELLVCDGYGLAHPRRFGLACHIGVLTGLPAIGVAKTAFVGRYDVPAPERGSWAPIVDGGEVVGRALRTRAGVKPVYVSQGHRIGLDAACRHVLRLAPEYRLPEPIRRADRLSRSGSPT